MTVRQLIEKLEALPENYEVIYECGDGYYAYVNEIIVNDKAKEVELY